MTKKKKKTILQEVNIHLNHSYEMLLDQKIIKKD